MLNVEGVCEQDEVASRNTGLILFWHAPQNLVTCGPDLQRKHFLRPQLSTLYTFLCCLILAREYCDALLSSTITLAHQQHAPQGWLSFFQAQASIVALAPRG
jgi:hypothetical protein